MITKETINTILVAGCQAPSGGNSQPWRFVVKDNIVDVYAEPEKDHPILNVDYKGTWLAHGALLENISLAASAQGLYADIQLFPEIKVPLLSAKITLKPVSIKPDPFYKVIYQRTTNRKLYTDKILSEEDRKIIQGAVQASDSLNIIFIDDSAVIKKITGILSVSERIMFSNKRLHELLFKEIVFNKAQEQKKGGGLLLHTLELNILQRIMLRILRFWPVMRIGIALGIPKQIAKDNAAVYESSKFLSIIYVKDDASAFIIAGRQIQRLWLAATVRGISTQLITGLFFFQQGVKRQSGSIFNPAEKEDISLAYNTIDKIFPQSDKTIVAILRFGFSDEPSARSQKKPPRVIYQ